MRHDFPPLSCKKEMTLPGSCVDFPTAASLLLGEKNGSKLLSQLPGGFTEGFFSHLCIRLTFKKTKMKCCSRRGKGQFFVAAVPPPDVLGSRSKEQWSYT